MGLLCHCLPTSDEPLSRLAGFPALQPRTVRPQRAHPGGDRIRATDVLMATGYARPARVLSFSQIIRPLATAQGGHGLLTVPLRQSFRKRNERKWRLLPDLCRKSHLLLRYHWLYRCSQLRDEGALTGGGS